MEGASRLATVVQLGRVEVASYSSTTNKSACMIQENCLDYLVLSMIMVYCCVNVTGSNAWKYHPT
jgi:hypothetical protein